LAGLDAADIAHAKKTGNASARRLTFGRQYVFAGLFADLGIVDVADANSHPCLHLIEIGAVT